MDQVIYELKNPFEYARKGEQEKAQFIELTAPGFKHLQHHAPIQQVFMKAAIEAQSIDVDDDNDSNDSDDSGINGEQAIQLLAVSTCDLASVYEDAKNLFASLALVDGSERLTKDLMGKMSADDFQGLVGAYIANFIAPSLMGGT